MPDYAPAECVRVTQRSALERASWLALGVTLAAAVAVRFVGLDHLPGINGDEAAYGAQALAWFDGAPLSQLRTGTDLPMNPLFFGVVAGLHAALGPSAFTLRLAALVHSLLVLALSLLLFRRRGLAFAALFTCLLAVLPLHLGYARFAWDTAAVPTAALLMLAAATRLRPGWTALAFVLGLWVHPVMVFSLPFVAAPFIVRAWPRTPGGGLRVPARRDLAIGFASVLLACGIAGVLVRLDALPAPVMRALGGTLFDKIAHRLTSPLEALDFARFYVELLCGPTIYRYIAGSLPPVAAGLHVVLWLACTVPVLVLALRRFRDERRWEEIGWLIGLLASLALAYVLGGLRVLRPGTERYGIQFTVPSAYVLALCLDALGRDARRRARLRLSAAIAGAALVCSFAVFHLAALHHADAEREDAFRTGDTDPKLRALQAVLRLRTPGRPCVVLAQDWWIYWPVRYFSHGQPDFYVTIAGMPHDYRFPPDFVLPSFRDREVERFAIAWAGGPYDAYLSDPALQRTEIGGYEPGPILKVIRLPVLRALTSRAAR